MAIFVNNLQDRVDVGENLEKDITRVAEKVMLREGFAQSELSIVFVDDAYIQELNFKYRNIDGPTDVLSFYFDDEDDPAEGEHLLGDVVISLETAVRQAAEYGHSITREVLYLATHGTLHLCGYDHDTDENRQVMRKIEEEVLKDP